MTVIFLNWKSKMTNAQINTLLNDLKWDSIQRFEEIERTLFWQGTLSRQDLACKLKMSHPQTTTIIKNYLALNPNKFALNQSNKKYIPNDDIPFLFYKPDIQDVFSIESSYDINTYRLTPITRHYSIPVIRDISRAIQNKQSININYLSRKNPTGEMREISPHTFVDTGKRLHIRAWCHKRLEFRDFIIGRISETKDFGVQQKTMFDDDDWNTLLLLKIRTNKNLSTEESKMIEMDYCMSSGVLEIKVRRAMLIYYLFEYNLIVNNNGFEPCFDNDLVLADDDILQYL